MNYKKQIKKTITFIITLKIMKFLGINLISENLCNENYKTMMKKMEEEKVNGKIYHIHG